MICLACSGVTVLPAIVIPAMESQNDALAMPSASPEYSGTASSTEDVGGGAPGSAGGGAPGSMSS